MEYYLQFIMRKRQTRFNYGERCRPVSLDAYSLDSVSAYNSVRRKGVTRSSKRSYGNPTFEDSVSFIFFLFFFYDFLLKGRTYFLRNKVHIARNGKRIKISMRMVPFKTFCFPFIKEQMQETNGTITYPR